MKLVRYLWCLLSILGLIGCSDNGNDSRGPELNLSVNELPVFSAEGETVSLNITTNVPWSITAEQEWCVVSPTTGKEGVTSVSVRCTENGSYDERNSALIVRYGDNGTQKLLVVQKQKDALLLSSNKVEMDAEGGDVTIEIKANVDYECNVEQDAEGWIKVVEVSRGLKESTLCLNVAENSTKEKRVGQVTLKKGTLQEIIHVYQEGFHPSIVLSANQVEVESEATNVKVEVKSNVDYEMVLPTGIDWINVEDSRAVSSYTYHFRISTNESYDSRTADIRFLNTDLGLEEKITIVQMQRNAILIAQKEYVVPANVTELSFEVNSNVDFKVTTSDQWIRELVESRALKETKLRFVLDENSSALSRVGAIYITSGKLEQVIQVVQEGWTQTGHFVIVHTNRKFEIPLLSGNNVSGRVDWGDGTVDDYVKGLSHTYNHSSEHVVTTDVVGASDIRISGIKGIVQVDLTEF